MSSPPGPDTSRARARHLGIATIMGRVDECEAMLASGLSARRVAGLCSQRWGLSRRQAAAYVTAVHERWAQGGARDRESKRAEMRAKFQHLHRVALRAKRPVVLLGTMVEYARSPDYGSALKALEHESKLDGLYDTSESDQRAIALVLEVAKASLEPPAYAALVRGLARASGRDGGNAQLSARSD